MLLFVVLFFKLYQLQIGRHDELQKKAINQQVRSTVVTASRGTIYDASGNILAISSTAETVFLDPNAIDKALSDTEKPVAWTRELIAQRLGEILGISEDSILEKMERTYSQYEVLKLRVDEDVANEVRSFINEYSVKGIYLSPDAKRYYPYGTLASQVIGFVGTDNTGLYGLEAQYEDQLEGQTGLVVTARDNAATTCSMSTSSTTPPRTAATSSSRSTPPCSTTSKRASRRCSTSSTRKTAPPASS